MYNCCSCENFCSKTVSIYPLEWAFILSHWPRLSALLQDVVRQIFRYFADQCKRNCGSSIICDYLIHDVWPMQKVQFTL